MAYGVRLPPVPESMVSLFPPPPALVDLQVEQALLGTLIARPDKISDLPPSFIAEHYADEAHAEIHRAIIALAATGSPSSHEIAHALRGSGIELGYIASLLNAMIAPGMAAGHANLITDLWRRREMERISRQMLSDAAHSGMNRSVAAIISEAIGELDRIGNSTAQVETMFDIDTAAAVAIEFAERLRAGGTAGVRTGFKDVDEALGPLEPGSYNVLAARPGMGKTALAAQIALQAARVGIPTFYDSLEMQAQQIGRRVLSFETGISVGALRRGSWSIHDAEMIAAAQKRLHGVPLVIDQQSGISMQTVALKARQAKRRFKGLGLIIVDHLHIIATDMQAERNGAARAVEKVSNDLKRLAVDMNVPVLALAQLNRGVEAREDKRPGLADLRQSGAIEQDADSISFLYRGEYYLTKTPPEHDPGKSDDQNTKALNTYYAKRETLAGRAEFIISKLRDGEPTTVPLRFNGLTTSFSDEAVS